MRFYNMRIFLRNVYMRLFVMQVYFYLKKSFLFNVSKRFDNITFGSNYELFNKSGEN